ncbi:leishmanolysin family protein, putative [Ichthyophthirius multifiliis]|uniref:Leishmanolysin family protein, putative n=1 Tax=Ichthyophthirius multifiliis TaxID=5932 RepID=G0R423_ICHMU|nr:leishmanolysin family protein, putative [Ichthyophthirius multifiliis]EGR27784.1 leishmanolysin family protein, putative [Ichthyophthirius multifiliis]|eukprot:XP_004026851.1 leishmanolysin family protein, putative [Ichthyophthirius multifiliis]
MKKLILTFLLINFIFGLKVLKHKCRHDKIKQTQKYDSLPPVESIDFRNLQNKKPRDMLITYDMSFFKKLPNNDYNQKLIATIEKALQLATDYFSRLIKIYPKSQQNMRYIQNQSKCGEVIITQVDRIQGKNSDLHLYVSYSEVVDDDYLAQAIWCQFLQGLGPTHGEVNFNLAQLKSQNISDAIQFEDLMEIVIHEITHVLGFMDTDIPKWVTSDGKPHVQPTIKATIRGVENLLIKTPNVLNFARKYFGCPTLLGMPLHNQDGIGTANCHWKSSDIQNEYMNPSTSPTQAYFSGFTANLLRDTGFYAEINTSMEEQTFYGKGVGCNHIMGQCNSSTREYCNPQTDDGLCDYYHHGSSKCHNDSGCNILVTYTNTKCWNVQSNQNTQEARQKYGVKYGIDSRCFNGSLKTQNYEPNNQIIGECYKYECKSNKQQVDIWVGQDKQTCQKNSQKLQYKGYSGHIQCPKNIQDFCNFKKFCPGFCNGNGYCLKDKCYCAKGFSGNDCSIKKAS